METATQHKSNWYAIRTNREFLAEEALRPHVDEVFFPRRTVAVPGHKDRQRALIPHVLFIRATEAAALALEQASRLHTLLPLSFWIYRLPDDDRIRPISQRHIDLLRLLSSDPTGEAEILVNRQFNVGQRVRVTAGIFQGLEGTVRRIRKNLHVLVELDGLCVVILPRIHPNLLQPL